MTPDSLTAYTAIVSGCGIADVSDHARLWAEGRDRIDLIHRMSTNDLLNMAENEGRATVLTTAVARMVDRIVVINLAERALVLGSAGMAPAIRRWLAGYIFFQDEVRFVDATAGSGQFVLFGPTAGAVAEALIPGAGALQPFNVLHREGLILGRGDPLAGSSFFGVASKDQLTQWTSASAAAGAVAADRELYQLVRVESGLPEIGHEIGEGYIPLEAGLWGDVSFTKGCYIGQEIIARMESRGKLAKRLMGVLAEGPLTAGVEFEGGVVTSAAHSPRLGWIGLAFVLTVRAEPGAGVDIAGTRATIAALPFEAQ
ncbi:MAG: glycine cleavage system protein T [Chloroflexi bacterium]|nr:glycine cleavage system protein T [Chloroflexota bacterium]